MIIAAFTWNVSAGAIIAMVVSVATIAVIFKSGGPWKTVAEGYEKERDQLREENKTLHKQVAALEARPDLNSIAQILATITGSLSAVVVRLEGLQETQGMLDHSLQEHSEAAAARHQAILNAIQTLGIRPTTARTRASDV